MRYEHLLGMDFDIEQRNCYQLIRDIYRDNWGIELTDYACPTDWWAHGMNLFLENAEDEGFSLIHDNPRLYRPGDVLILALNSSIGNHAACLVGHNLIVHHLVGQRSTVTSYGGLFRNNTVAVYRHRDVPPPVEQTVDLKDLLPPHVRRRLEASGRLASGEAPAG